ncbi:MAG TPA: fibronectin type III domain-containing protein, partial [Gammaproteobacteria bacterium]
AITGYTVTSSPGGLTGTGASSPITVTGLTNGTAYTFTVTATNSAGTGSASAASNSVTPMTVPGAPTIGTATAGNTEATVTFTAPASNGGSAITGYTATSSPGGLTGTGASSPITVTGLTNGTAYTFTVTATNSAGTGSASAASNSVTPGPEIIAPADVTVDAVGLFTPVSIGTATAVDSSLTPVVTHVNDQAVTETPTHFLPGANTVTWSATDGDGNTGTAIQYVNVNPLVNFSKSQVSAEGATASFKVVLNGPAVTYPVTVPYTVAGTAAVDGSDHNLTDGSVTINSPDLEATVTVTLVDDGAGEGTEGLVVTLGTPANAVAGLVTSHTIEIHEDNVAPTVVLSADQASSVTRIIDQASGVVTVTAAVADPNVGDIHAYNWSDTDNALVDSDGVDSTFTLDPSTLTPGVYTLKVAVNDETATGNAELLLKVEATPPVLTAVDTDGDGVDDDIEGVGDSDGDGIPGYLDNLNLARNVMQEMQAVATQYLMETEPGLALSLGDVALRAGGYKVGVDDVDVEEHGNGGAGAVLDTEYSYDGGLFDFNVSELPVAGQQVKVVLAQFAAIPANAVYRKLTASGWQDFVIDANNNVASAAGGEGYCPSPGDSVYTSGLTEGHWCVQLTIEDGGPNDADGAADQQVKDPGGVGLAIAQPLTIVITGGGGALSPWLLLLLIVGVIMRHMRYISKRAAMGHALAVLLAVISGNTQAAESKFMPSYAGLNYLAVKSDDRSGDFDADLADLGLTGSVTQADLSRSGWSAYIGYQLDEHFAVDLGYADLGDVTTTISGSTTDVNSYLASASAVHPTTASGWTLSFVMRKTLYNRVDGLFRLGAFWWEADYTLASATASRSFSDSGVNGNLGIGVEIKAAPYLPVRLGWSHYEFGGTTVTSWELGVGYRF